jgi:hypothetical protein
MKKLVLNFLIPICCSFLFTSFSFSQTVYEPIHSSVYNFLDRMAEKGIVVFHDEIRPVSREYIAEKLLQVKDNEDKIIDKDLTSLEKKELEFYLKDFGIELKQLEAQGLTTEYHSVPYRQQTATDIPHTTILSSDPYGRWRSFFYEDSQFILSGSPILGYQVGTRDGAKYSHRWNGVSLYGYLSNSLGFNFRFWDNSESGTTIDKTKNFSPATGVIIAKGDANNIQYSEVNMNIAYDWKGVDISIGKDFLNWGYGQSGLLVLSDKAPSFPFVRLDINPTSWLRFNYLHAWLNSDVIDSTLSYSTFIPGTERVILRDKYFASHTLTLVPSKGLAISMGESVIYSDKDEILYWMPIMFFRLADHYLSDKGGNNAGSNSQFFLGVSSRDQIKNTHLYGTLFIDEITIEGLFDPKKQRNQFGFTVGGSVTDLPVDNLTLTAEFTKIFPYVYTHYIPTETYQNAGYVMGHWMGNNADLAYYAADYRFFRGFQATLWGEYVRKGGQGPEQGQYTQPQPPFLYGLRTNHSYLGVEIKYEITHEFFAKLQYQSTEISMQQPDLNYKNNRLNEFYVAFYYGIK